MASALKAELSRLVPQAKHLTVPGAGLMMTETHGTEVANAMVEYLNSRNGYEHYTSAKQIGLEDGEY